MGFIPEAAKWYLADLVIATSVGTRKKVTVHVNTVLVRADAPRDAHARALALGKEQQKLRYENAAGDKVSFRFLGLRDLQVVHDDLEHGCELRYTQAVRRTMAQARALVTPRSRLAVFAPRVPSRAPDYMSGDIRRALDVIAGESCTKKRRRTRA
jgi:hypothetical protein